MISDWQGIDRITSPPHANYTYSIIASVTAGVDMVSIMLDTLKRISTNNYMLMYTFQYR